MSAPSSPAGDSLSLWWAQLDVPSPALADLTATLSPRERRRADERGPGRDRDRFLAARGWLRRLLGQQLRCPPQEVAILSDDGGKPRLAGSALSFSAARSEGVAVYATSWSMEVGVDVEAIRTAADVDGIARRFFSPPERRALAALPAQRRLTAAFECWTRKEAYLKGTGAGLSVELATVDVWSADGRPVTVGDWRVHQIEVAAGFAAAVAGAQRGHWVPAPARRLDRRGFGDPR